MRDAEKGRKRPENRLLTPLKRSDFPSRHFPEKIDGPERVRERMVRAASQKWGYVRIITGTILGGVLGFYVMHRVEVSYKEKMKEELKKYEAELKKKEKMNEIEESL